MKAFTVALLLLFSFQALADDDAPSIRGEVKSCWRLQDRFGQELCLAKIGEELEAERKRLRNQRIELIYNTNLKTQILAASDTWSRLRESECSVVRDQFESASMQSAKVKECEIYFTLQRIGNLRHYIDCTENGCPWFF
ncbi:hypothetical protein ACTXGQ_11415 [Marinobacter sp. 1Y8]